MARLTVRQLWKARLEGKVRAVAPANGAEASGRRVPFEGHVLGIDPSLRTTGLAVVQFSRRRSPLLLHSRTVRIRSTRPMPECLGAIHQAVVEVLEQHRVLHVALEQTIYVQNFQTAQLLGAARGAAIAAAAARGLSVFEYPPLRVKQAVVGVGRASKEQMARTVMSLLGHGRALEFDEADAVGVALCHAFTWRPDPE